VILFSVIHKHGVINMFEQFDKTLHHYHFWVWLPPEVVSASEHHLRPRIGLIATLMILPPLAFAGAVYSVLWVYRAFRTAAGGRRSAPSREMAKPRSLKPAFDALDLVIGQSAQISTLREQADGVDHSP
jgi:hypothetical protein